MGMFRAGSFPKPRNDEEGEEEFVLNFRNIRLSQVSQ